MSLTSIRFVLIWPILLNIINISAYAIRRNEISANGYVQNVATLTEIPTWVSMAQMISIITLHPSCDIHTFGLVTIIPFYSDGMKTVPPYSFDDHLWPETKRPNDDILANSTTNVFSIRETCNWIPAVWSWLRVWVGGRLKLKPTGLRGRGQSGRMLRIMAYSSVHLI